MTKMEVFIKIQKGNIILNYSEEKINIIDNSKNSISEIYFDTIKNEIIIKGD